MRSAILVDIANTYISLQRAYGKRLNYDKLMSNFSNVIFAYAYGTIVNDSSIKFFDALRHLGYELKTVRANKNVDFNVSIAIDVIKISERIDQVIICSSNSQLAPLLEWLNDKGIKITILGCHIPSILRNLSTNFIEITEEYLENEADKATK